MSFSGCQKEKVKMNHVISKIFYKAYLTSLVPLIKLYLNKIGLVMMAVKVLFY